MLFKDLREPWETDIDINSWLCCNLFRSLQIWYFILTFDEMGSDSLIKITITKKFTFIYRKSNVHCCLKVNRHQFLSNFLATDQPIFTKFSLLMTNFLGYQMMENLILWPVLWKADYIISRGIFFEFLLMRFFKFKHYAIIL